MDSKNKQKITKKKNILTYKKTLVVFLLESLFFALFLFFVGSAIVNNPILGDINFIDEGQFGAWVTHLLHGQYLYKDVYAAYGPFYIYPLLFASKIFGQSIFLIRLIYMSLSTFLSLMILRLI